METVECTICKDNYVLEKFKTHVEKKHPEILGCLLAQICILHNSNSGMGKI